LNQSYGAAGLNPVEDRVPHHGRSLLLDVHGKLSRRVSGFEMEACVKTGEIKTGRYKDQEAVILENNVLTATILPQWGSKLASLVYKPLGFELLWQNPAPKYRASSYADPYELGEASGFDEMFPTIARCFYEGQPWVGLEMPDHGEVWSIPWAYEIEGQRLLLRVEGVRFPYGIEKTVSLSEEVLQCEYRVENRCEADFDFIWAAHPLFNTSPGMRLIVPGDLRTIVNAVPSRRLGGYGRMYHFPIAKIEGRGSFNLSVVPEKGGADYQKYWFVEKPHEGWCILHDPLRKLSIGLAWPVEQVPYLGMWVNEGGWSGQYNVAPEPATAAMDRVDFSKAWGMGNNLRSGEIRQWWLTISARQGGEPEGGSL
jgi:galactose mutarotase-like enzyme